MIIVDINRDEVISVLEHLYAVCACRLDCIDCPYADDYLNCTIQGIPEEWRLKAIKDIGGDADDPN